MKSPISLEAQKGKLSSVKKEPKVRTTLRLRPRNNTFFNLTNSSFVATTLYIIDLSVHFQDKVTRLSLFD